ncbi:MAG: PorT family protein [Bacteroidaceae bacterium]|nr:PorT family protein [Bacteroidaceae bacterium]
MKKLLVIVMVVASILVAPMAQAEFRFGVKAGANISNFIVEGENPKLDFENASLANFTGGLSLEWIIWGGLGFDAGVMYTAKGTEYKVGDDLLSGIYTELLGTESLMKATVHYIEVPINLKYRLEIPVVKDIIIPFVYAGPSFAFKVGQDVSFGNNILEDTKVDFSNIDYALNVGLGVELFKHLNVAAQYGWGMGKVADTDMEILGQKIEGLDMKSGVWTVTVGWMF